MFETSIELGEPERSVVCDQLNYCLCNTITGQLGTKFAHWNVKGEGFWAAHKLFDKVNSYLLEAIDITAERIGSLGGSVYGKIQDVYDIADIPEYEASSEDQVMTHILAMSSLIGFLANMYRDASKVCQDQADANSVDMCTEISRELDHQLYFLEAHLR